MPEEPLSAETPFHQARGAFAGLIGSALSERDFWKRFGIGSAVVNLGLLGICVWLAARSPLIPYVIELGEDTRVVRARLAEQFVPSDANYRGQAQTWIRMTRRVSHDPFAMQQDIIWAYDRTSGPARTKLNAFFQDRGGLIPTDKRMRSVEDVLVLKQGARIFQVDWTETVYTERGDRMATDRWRARITFEHHQPKTEDEVRRNPVGLYVVDFEWQRV